MEKGKGGKARTFRLCPREFDAFGAHFAVNCIVRGP